MDYPFKTFPSTPSPPSKPEIDGLLADAGYRIKASDLPHVAHRLEQLETQMINAQPTEMTHLASETVHYNPSDLATWVESMLFELNPSEIPATSGFAGESQSPEIGFFAGNQNRGSFSGAAILTHEEDSGIRLIHLLMSCAGSVERGEREIALKLVQEMRLLLCRNITGVIGKVAVFFVDALFWRLSGHPSNRVDSGESEFLYHHFYEGCPYLKFAHFTCNQAILEAFDGCDEVHVIDFNLIHGLQWPALIQALALRPGGPPFLRLTGIGPPSPDGRDTIREVGIRLAELARSVNVRFAFRGVATQRLEDLKPWMIHVRSTETVAVNSVFVLHRLLYTTPDQTQPIKPVLNWVRELGPKILTVVEQEASHNGLGFVDRFTEALHYYSAMFDSMEGSNRNNQAFAELYLEREIKNIVCCEGSERVERHEPLTRWRGRFDKQDSNRLDSVRMRLDRRVCCSLFFRKMDLGWRRGMDA
ncbi:hypothetical protein AMTR_s00122p00135250 [Amborella trichopoda]|uniref:DELLA protein n=1 Tax=Amborella trichopoda TaxID=13333 RepID=W1NQJ9_AMBTC|nr:hypothetical protein AMTR_s00122p00135250 [Amborella trichopoda]